jgi:2'-deoxynucleoside 5'-phosphate N-hydrolase
MNIYFACSITGGRQFEPVYKAIVDALEAQGHDIPTAHLAEPGVAAETALSAHDVYERDTAWIRGCDVLIAEVSVPSHGVGYEIGYALGERKPVLCLYQEGCRLSKMISGNPHPLLQVSSYVDVRDAISLAGAFLVTNAL